MIDTPHQIRQQMAETKSQLTEKLETLENQVSETVQSTGTAVVATVEAVQDAVVSVKNALDLPRQFDKHPWLILGGAALLGYIAADLFTDAKPAASCGSGPGEGSSQGSNGSSQIIRSASLRENSSAASVAAAYESGRDNSAWYQLRGMVINTLLGAAQEVAARVTPALVESLTSQLNPPASSGAGPTSHSNGTASPPKNVSPRWPLDVA